VKRALVTGGSGQVGKAVIAAAARHGFAASAPPRAVLDLARPETIAAALAGGAWDVVINCAAYTAVDKAESEPELADAINHIAPGILASETAGRGIPLIHVSTDYVFDGSKFTPYDESDPFEPVSVYGASKRAGEDAIRSSNPAHAILRTAWVLSAHGVNFLNTMLRLAESREALGVVSDQIGCPTSADDIAEALLTIATRMTGADVPSGTWHFVNSGDASWHDLAAFIFARSRAAGLKAPALTAIPTADYPTPARRPANSRLDTAKFTLDFGFAPRPWQEAVNDILDTRLAGAAA
jgi:dTDP-4-dehydrorhamnose reductase